MSSGGDAAASEAISLPAGGGAFAGIGEKFSPDMQTGTGNLVVPIALPKGRSGFQPELSLIYSSGNGGDAFGLGWSLSIPGVARGTSKGTPRYDDGQDTFVLSGAEDLVPVERVTGRTAYRPRTEGSFARIEHLRDATTDHWRVEGRDGLTSYYGTPAPSAGPHWRDPAVVADPRNRARVFAWKLSETRDPFGNRIVYEYDRDLVTGERNWDRLYLRRIRYADYTAGDGTEQFLVSVSFEYEQLPSRYETDHPAERRVYPNSDFRAGFEIRTRRRCKRIVVRTHPDGPDPSIRDEGVLVRSYSLAYLDERAEEMPAASLPRNGVSLLSRVTVTGHDEAHRDARRRHEELPPLEFGYSRFAPEDRDLTALAGELPADSLARSEIELVDLTGNGLPDILEMNGAARWWRNLGDGEFDRPRSLGQTPAGLSLTDPGVQLLDADGDGRVDLLVCEGSVAGYYPSHPEGGWDRESFRRHEQAPGIALQDPQVALIDLDGDGVTDAIRSGSRFECFFNDPRSGWRETRQPRRHVPGLDFADPRVRLADMSGDGLQDIVLVYDRNVEFWPALGRGEWGQRIHMRDSPRFPVGYDPERILLGDVDGDGLADLIYVDHDAVTLWINQCGNGWSDPITITGTPPVTDFDAVQLADVLGSGIRGLLWSRDAGSQGRAQMLFLDFSAATKPYLLNEVDNNMGAATNVEYAPSTRFYLADDDRPESRWQGTLPFPVQVVARVESIDEVSGGKLTTEYRYRHGYWDGAEREFRGFGLVEQLDSESFAEYHQPGPDGERRFEPVHSEHFSPPTLTRTWFHLGALGNEFGEWHEADYSAEYWSQDPQGLERPAGFEGFLRASDVPRRAKRDAVRALRGRVLRTELYALDGGEREDRPYAVSERLHSVRPEVPPGPDGEEPWVFFPHTVAKRETEWERGEDPRTRFSFYDDFDEYGQPCLSTEIACPRGWRRLNDTPGSPYLATRERTVYAAGPDRHLVDRIARVETSEIVNDGTETVLTLAALPDASGTLRTIGHTVNYYDGDAFTGLPAGEVGSYGALVRSESLVLTEEMLRDAYRGDDTAETPPYLAPDGSGPWPGEYPQEFRDRIAAMRGLAGFTFHPGSATRARGYYAVTARHLYDFHVPTLHARGLLLASRDPLGGEAAGSTERDTVISHDAHQLLPVRVTEPGGLTTRVAYDYRALEPSLAIDANGNRQAFGFTALGLLAWIAVMGKEGEDAGDTRERPGTRFEYDFGSFAGPSPGAKIPVSVRTIRRVHHVRDSDVPPPEREETIETVEYSDGFGRVVQTRDQADDELVGETAFGEGVLPADPDNEAGSRAAVTIRRRAPGAPTNVIVSGWTIYDNKGSPVERYEPFFDTSWAYLSRAAAAEEASQPAPTRNLFGRKETLSYDPRGRVVRTVSPGGAEQRVVHGAPADLRDPDAFAPNPWEAFSYDRNDLAPLAAVSRSLSDRVPDDHHFTPSSVVVDALGRTVEAVKRNGPEPDGLAVTRCSYDVRGNLLSITDPLGREAFSYAYDLAGATLRVESLDAGIRRMVADAAGNEVERRDGRGALVLHGRDQLGRPVRVWARDDREGGLSLRERVVYGDSVDSPTTRDEAVDRNLLGRPHHHHDEAGLLRVDRYDFKGNLLEKTRRTIRDEAILAAFDAPSGAVATYRVDWEPAAGESLATLEDELLDSAGYEISTTYDALGRGKAMNYPRDGLGGRAVLHPAYNRAGRLGSLTLDDDPIVERITYNAKGQRTLVAYGNGIMTRYAHDAHTSRLVRQRSEPYSMGAPDSTRFEPRGDPLQDLTYEHDLSANVTAIRDRAPDCGIPASPLGPDALDRVFAYDPLYRLSSATGRECDVPYGSDPWQDQSSCDDPAGVRAYEQRFNYDPLGNLRRLDHVADGGFTRTFRLESGTNRPAALETSGGSAVSYGHDDNGNMASEGAGRRFEWDHRNRLKSFQMRDGGLEASLHVHYLYDASGQRVMKLVRRAGGQYDVRVYVDGLFEHHRWDQLGPEAERRQNDSLHVLDDHSRIALVRRGPGVPDDGLPATIFHLADHLESSNVIVDGAGNRLDREEYLPYGGTSFGGFAAKRYRFAGKERDAESNSYYFGARHYAPWLCRWMSPDPLGLVDGLGVYSFSRSNPISLRDPSGAQATNQEHPLIEVDAIETRKPPGTQAASAAPRAAPRDDIGRALDASSAVGNLFGAISGGFSAAADLAHLGTVWPVEAPAAAGRWGSPLARVPANLARFSRWLGTTGNSTVWLGDKVLVGNWLARQSSLQVPSAMSGAGGGAPALYSRSFASAMKGVGIAATAVGLATGAANLWRSGNRGDQLGMLQAGADTGAGAAGLLGPGPRAFSAGWSVGSLANAFSDPLLDPIVPHANLRGLHGDRGVADIDNSLSGWLLNLSEVSAAGWSGMFDTLSGDERSALQRNSELFERRSNPVPQLIMRFGSD